MKMKALVMITLLCGALLAGAMLDSSVPLVSARAAVAAPKCEACR